MVVKGASPIFISKMRIAIYARFSTKDKGQDKENQLAQVREFASKQGWQIVPEFIDHETGGKSHRVEFQTMFEADSQRKFDLLLFLGFGPALA
jgi:DNA invertase Pin-like site-specific DNA recombinase